MRGPLNELGVPPCWRAYFLLLRQKKVAKEKATPGYAVGCADSPALLEACGGCGTRATPSDSPRPCPPASALLGAPHGDPKVKTEPGPDHRHSRLRGNDRTGRSARVVFPGPLRGAEQRRAAGGSRLALSEPKASLASRPAVRVAQGTRAAGTAPGVAFSLATFFWRSKRKYARQQGGTPSQFRNPQGEAKESHPCLMP
jgi:hypothetical protein